MSEDQQWKTKCDAARALVMNNVEEVKNEIGGVVGYSLNLTPSQTELLCQILENDKRP